MLLFLVQCGISNVAFYPSFQSDTQVVKEIFLYQNSYLISYTNSTAIRISKEDLLDFDTTI